MAYTSSKSGPSFSDIRVAPSPSGSARSSPSPSLSQSQTESAFEDARSEIESDVPGIQRGGARAHREESTDFSDDLELPPLESFFSLAERASLNGSIENDLLPSTPLTEEQLKHADSVLKDDLNLNGVTINRYFSATRPFICLYKCY